MKIALEGHSYSGKTTLLNFLRDTKSKNIIAEHDIYAQGIENYPPFPPTTFEMARDNVDFFANLEIARASDAAQLTGTVFFDRSFVSVILFQKFMKFLAIPGQFNAYGYSKSIFADLLKREQVTFPDFLVFMSCKSESDYKRRTSREVSVGLLRTDQALHFFTQEYMRICTIFEKQGRLLRITSQDGRSSLTQNASFLEEINPRPLSESEKNSMMTEFMEVI